MLFLFFYFQQPRLGVHGVVILVEPLLLKKTQEVGDYVEFDGCEETWHD
jgi:hypothetical protein